jgi:hypothetical protein
LTGNGGEIVDTDAPGGEFAGKDPGIVSQRERELFVKIVGAVEEFERATGRPLEAVTVYRGPGGWSMSLQQQLARYVVKDA